MKITKSFVLVRRNYTYFLLITILLISCSNSSYKSSQDSSVEKEHPKNYSVETTEVFLEPYGLEAAPAEASPETNIAEEVAPVEAYPEVYAAEALPIETSPEPYSVKAAPAIASPERYAVEAAPIESSHERYPAETESAHMEVYSERLPVGAATEAYSRHPPTGTSPAEASSEGYSAEMTPQEFSHERYAMEAAPAVISPEHYAVEEAPTESSTEYRLIAPEISHEHYEAEAASEATIIEESDDYRVDLGASKLIEIPGTPGELLVWIGKPAYKSNIPASMNMASEFIPEVGVTARVTPSAPAFKVKPKESICMKIHRRGSVVRFLLIPTKKGIFNVGADVHLYESKDCSGSPIPEVVASLQVTVRVDHVGVFWEYFDKLIEVFWEKFLEFWGRVIALIFAVFLFLIKGKLKKWFGYKDN